MCTLKSIKKCLLKSLWNMFVLGESRHQFSGTKVWRTGENLGDWILLLFHASFYCSFLKSFNFCISVIMPPSALEQLTRLSVEYPMIFKLTNKKTRRQTHSGVLEFVADEGKVYLPHWVYIFIDSLSVICINLMWVLDRKLGPILTPNPFCFRWWPT